VRKRRETRSEGARKSASSSQSDNLVALPTKFIPLRESPTAPDTTNDGKRLEWMRQNWLGQDELLRTYHRQVEENVRMLSGQQYSIYHPALRQWLNVQDWMTPDELRWRQRPVFNRLLPWFMITHARATENTPIITFAPGPDRIDAELAEVMDVAGKTLWREMGMAGKHSGLMAWVIAAGRGHHFQRVDFNRGPIRKWIGQADLPMMDETGENPQVDPETNEPILMQGIDNIPHDSQGQPLAHIDYGGNLQITGEPHEEREGVLRCDVLSPLNVRASWGPEPWHEKRVHFIRTYHTPEEAYDLTGIELDPDVRGDEMGDITELERLLYSTGFYTAIDSIPGSQMQPIKMDGLVQLDQRWEVPSSLPGLEETSDKPGGRLTIATKKAIVYDGQRPGAFPYCSPLSTFEFVRLPGRHQGTTPQEALNPIQRAYNEGYGRIREHVNLSTNPKGVIDIMSGIKAGQFTNAPGDNYVVTRRPGVPAIEYVSPPPLGEDVYKLQQMLGAEFLEIGQTRNQAEQIPKDASGQLIKELRFDDDRFIGDTMRRTVEEYGREIETQMVWLKQIWDEQRILSYAGDDNVARTIVVMPYMFQKGKINIIPDVESMLPESRGERQNKIMAFYNMGLLGGPPGSPQANKKFAEIGNYPHLNSALKPGGVDRVTAEQENGQLVQGVDPRQLPVFEWYDHDVHLYIHESFMKSPEFKKMTPQVQAAFAFHREAHTMARDMAMAKEAQKQMQLQAMMTPQLPPGNGAGGSKSAAGGAASQPMIQAPPAPPRGVAATPTQLSR
jgi:hypothetical protein